MSGCAVLRGTLLIELNVTADKNLTVATFGCHSGMLFFILQSSPSLFQIVSYDIIFRNRLSLSPLHLGQFLIPVRPRLPDLALNLSHTTKLSLVFFSEFLSPNPYFSFPGAFDQITVKGEVPKCKLLDTEEKYYTNSLAMTLTLLTDSECLKPEFLRPPSLASRIIAYYILTFLTCIVSVLFRD